MTDFQKKYGGYLDFFEAALKKYCAEMNDLPSMLAESMRYSLLSGGKRVRPVLFFAALELFGRDFRGEAPLAVALECIHTYSLIHDDLPAMDDDDYRRGNPSNHKVFGEANAILAGDGLLSEACSMLLHEGMRSEAHLMAAACLMDAAGARGMVAGQSADLLYSGKAGSEEELRYIYEHKTGRLLTAPPVMAAILAGGDEASMRRFGRELGMLFQLTDDLLDVKGNGALMGKTAGKDEREGKLTCVKVFGIEKSERLADAAAADCMAILRAYGGRAAFLEDLVRFVRSRDN